MEPRRRPAAVIARVRERAARRLRTLPDRHGGPVALWALAGVMAVGFAWRLYTALNPPEDIGRDASSYMTIARALFEDGTYGAASQSAASDWSPGAPLLYAALYTIRGAADPAFVRLVLVLLGMGTILLVYLIGRRLAGPWAGVIGAALAATYPALVENTGRLLAEPVALFVLPACVLAFLWASDGGSLWRWTLPGALLGATTLTRPEYLPFVAVLGALACARVVYLARGRLRAGVLARGVAAGALLAAAFVLVVGPWTARNYVVLDRFVPVTTGGGKALFIATYLPGEGRQQKVKRKLIERYYHKTDLPYPEVKATQMAPLLDRVARKYPELNRDAALGRIGRENFKKYVSEQPGAYAKMVAAKIGNMWDRGSTRWMSPKWLFWYHRVLTALAFVGLVMLAVKRRWEALVIGLMVLGITAVGGLLLAVPRRALPLMPMVLAFAAVPLAAWARPLLDRLPARARRGPAQPGEPSTSPAILTRSSWS